jgi:type IV pilus assembly protein PilO
MRFGIREAIFYLVLLAVPAVSFFYVFKPRNQDIQQAMLEIEEKQTRLDRLAQTTSRIDDLDLAIQEGRDSIASIEAKLPSEQDVEGILEKVWLIAKSNRQTVKGVKSEKPVPAALYRELPLKMTMHGDFEGFYQFLLELENLPRITRVHEMSLERAGHSDQRVTDDNDLPPDAMKAEFTLSIYFEATNANAS